MFTTNYIETHHVHVSAAPQGTTKKKYYNRVETEYSKLDTPSLGSFCSIHLLLYFVA